MVPYKPLTTVMMMIDTPAFGGIHNESNKYFKFKNKIETRKSQLIYDKNYQSLVLNINVP